MIFYDHFLKDDRLWISVLVGKKRIFNSCAFMIKVLFVSLPKKRDIRRQILSVIPPEFLWQSFWWNNCLGSYAIDIAAILVISHATVKNLSMLGCIENKLQTLTVNERQIKNGIM